VNLTDGRLSPAPGTDGLVARSAGAVLFVAARTPAGDVARLVGAVTGSAEAQPGRSLARQLAALVGSEAGGDLPGFALVAATPAGVYVKVYGSVEVHLVGDAGEEVLSAVGSYTGVDRELPGPFHTVVAHRAGEPAPTPDVDVDLRAGTTAGAGFALSLLTSAGPAGSVEAPPATPVAADAPPVVEAAPVAPPAPDAVPVPDASGSFSPPADAETNPYTSSASTEAAAAEAAVAPPASATGLDAPTQAWTPSTEDLAPIAPDGPPAETPAGDAPPAPDWGAATPEVPAPDAPAWGTAAPDAPGAPAWGAVEPDAAAPASDAPSTYQAPADPAAPPVAEPPAADEAPAPPAYEPATMPPTAIPAAPAGEFTSQLLGALDAEEPESRDALPLELDPADLRAPDQATSEVQVQGVICSRGHFNDPRSRFCSSCGISMVQNTQVLTRGPRPPLGVMVFEDGATFSLSSDYVVGRQPEVSDLVQDGLALPLPVDDPERSISRAHAELRLVEWDVHLVNLSVTNGSFVWDEGSQQWVPIPTGQSVVLTPGMRVALGRRSAVFESSLVR